MSAGGRLRLHAPLCSIRPLGEEERWARARADLQEGLAAVERQVSALSGVVAGRLEGVSTLVSRMALAVARGLVGSCLEMGEADLVPLVRRVLDEAVEGAGSTSATVFVSPEDLSPVLERLGPPGSDGGSEERGLRLLRFETDPNLKRGCVRVETDAGTWRYDPREVLARMEEELAREVRR